MKKTLLNFTRTIVAMTALGLMAPLALAWTPPSGGFPSGNVDAPINTGTVGQTKKGDFASLKNIVADGMSLGNSLSGGKRGVFGCNGTGFALLGCYLANNAAGNTDKLRAGSFTGAGDLTQGLRAASDGSVSIGTIVTGAAFPTKGLFVGNILGQAFNAFFGKLNITLAGTGSAGRNALEVTVSPSNTNDGATLLTNADRFSFWNSAGTDRVGLSAKRIQLTEGAAAGKVLTSDADGNGSWGDVAGAMDIIEVHIPTSGHKSENKSCPSHHPIALSAGGGCSKGMLTKVNVSFLGNANAAGNATVKCEQDPLHNTPAGEVDGVDLICAKAVPGGVYGGAVANGANGGGIPTVGWHTLASAPNGPTTVPANGTSCASWLAGGTYASNLKRAMASMTVNGTTFQVGTNPDSGNPQSCAYQFTTPQYQIDSVNNPGASSTSQGNSFAVIKSTCIFALSTASYPNGKPVKSCTDSAATFTPPNGSALTVQSYTMNTEVKY